MRVHGQGRVKIVNWLEDITAESGSIPKGAFERLVMQVLMVQRGDVEMYRRCGMGHLAGAMS